MFQKWLTAHEFSSLEPIDVFHRENEQKDVESLHPDELRNIHMLVRGKIILSPSDYDRIFIHVTADDYYKMKLNGRFIAQGPAPSYYFHYNWNRIDVTDALHDGENTAALDVYYQGLDQPGMEQRGPAYGLCPFGIRREKGKDGSYYLCG